MILIPLVLFFTTLFATPLAFEAVVEGRNGCYYYESAVKLVDQLKNAGYRGCRYSGYNYSTWPGRSAELRQEFGVNHSTSPFVYSVKDGKKVFIGGFDKFSAYVSENNLLKTLTSDAREP